MLVEPQTKLNFQKIILNSVSLDFSFVFVNFFYLHGDYGLGILNVFETNKHLSTMQNHWVVQIRLHICLLKTTTLFIKDHLVFFWENGLIV